MTKGARVGAAALSIAAIAGGGATAFLETREPGVTGEEASRAGAAALGVTRGGEVVAVERVDDGSRWAVEVLVADHEVEVTLDQRFEPVGAEREAADDGGAYGRAGPPSVAPDDSPLPIGEHRRAIASALEATGGGEVVSIERSDDTGESYELEVIEGGREIDVALDRDFDVVPNRSYEDD